MVERLPPAGRAPQGPADHGSGGGARWRGPCQHSGGTGGSRDRPRRQRPRRAHRPQRRRPPAWLGAARAVAGAQRSRGATAGLRAVLSAAAGAVPHLGGHRQAAARTDLPRPRGAAAGAVQPGRRQLRPGAYAHLWPPSRRPGDAQLAAAWQRLAPGAGAGLWRGPCGGSRAVRRDA